MSEGIVTTIIGIIGTILGVILGALLSKFQRIGRIKMFTNSIDILYIKSDDTVSSIQNQPFYSPDVFSVTITIDVEIYNTSSTDPQIARDIYLVYSHKGRVIKSRIKKRESRYVFSTIQLDNINIYPKNIEIIILSASFEDNLANFEKGKLYFEYRNNNNRKKRIRINFSKKTVL